MMLPQTRDSADIIWRHCVGAGRFSALPLVCFELLALVFAIAAGRMERQGRA